MFWVISSKLGVKDERLVNMIKNVDVLQGIKIQLWKKLIKAASSDQEALSQRPPTPADACDGATSGSKYFIFLDSDCEEF